ncbi:MAG: TIGR04211 family SH3 domain-containing protein [Hahellaceae bacterium]|nr:TIGR04211 family SH3 domain-containing protein [Hahellaceae bacterium]
MLRLILSLWVLVYSSAALAETQYIDDTLFAPLRSGKSNEYRIIHRGLKSGTSVEVLETDDESGYTLVRTPGGMEGWLLTQYLSKEPIAKIKLEKLTAEANQLRTQLQQLKTENTELKTQHQNLTNELSGKLSHLTTTQEELAHIKQVSENALQLDSKNRELRETNETLKNEVEVLTSENLRLKDRNDQDTMLLGAGLVFAGVLIAVIVPMFKREKKSSW